MRNKWTKQELSILRENYATTSIEDLHALLPLHPQSAIYSQAGDMHLIKSTEYRHAYLKENRTQAIKALTGKHPWNWIEPTQKTCETCSKIFEPSIRKDTARFCSRQCANDWKKTIRGVNHPLYTLVDRTCQWCKETFKAKPAEVAQGHALFCSRRCLGSYTTYTIGGKRSSLEIAIEQVLITLEEPFESQKQIGPWLVDFYLPNRNLVIECDGKYWHSIDKVAKRDRAKDYWLHKHNYKILRLKEDAIKANATQALTSGLQTS